jgi:hypothetical protein
MPFAESFSRSNLQQERNVSNGVSTAKLDLSNRGRGENSIVPAMRCDAMRCGATRTPSFTK